MSKSANSSSDQHYDGLYFYNETNTPVPVDASIVRQIISEISSQEDVSFYMVEVVFVDEETILELNRTHLQHDYVTDILTFRYDDENSRKHIETTLYCCAPRIREQASSYKQPVETEFRRVIIHGLLHLTGYNDVSEAAQKKMRKREDFYLDVLS
ncbi:MAG TPA: rRNA maturation RNase YbeY [Balneolaceae bacterium]|nr:rRNA maturation RNase YbeY [Balneolaceae bacterium]